MAYEAPVSVLLRVLPILFAAALVRPSAAGEPAAVEAAGVTPARESSAVSAPLEVVAGCPFDKDDSFLGLRFREPPPSDGRLTAVVDERSGFSHRTFTAPVSFEGVPLDPGNISVYYSPAWLHQVNVLVPDPATGALLEASLQRLCGPPARIVEGTLIWTTGRVVTQWTTSPPERAGIYISVY